MNDMIERLRRLLGSRGTSASSQDEPESPPGRVLLDADAVQRIMQAVAMTRDDELTCGEVYALLDEYVEYKLGRRDVAALAALMQHHLDMCPDCRDEFTALLHMAQDDQAGND